MNSSQLSRSSSDVESTIPRPMTCLPFSLSLETSGEKSESPESMKTASDESLSGMKKPPCPCLEFHVGQAFQPDGTRDGRSRQARKPDLPGILFGPVNCKPINRQMNAIQRASRGDVEHAPVLA